jgi:hypothetical protein
MKDEYSEGENFEFSPGPEMKKVDDNLEVGLIDDPDSFDIGVAAELGNALLIVFSPKDLPKQAIGFRGEAQEKFLQSIQNLLNLYRGEVEAERENPSWIAPTNQKKQTLH